MKASVVIANYNNAKYIDDCISKGYLHVLPSSKDHRKKVIIASDKMIKEMAEWLLEHSVTDT